MDAKQFAWTYLVTNGQANVIPSYYGGTKVVDNTAQGKKEDSYHSRLSYGSSFLEKIKAVGVDWEKTKAPTNNDYSVFTRTGYDAAREEHLEGTLILKDGTKQFWLGDLLTSNVFEMMERIDEFKESFTKIFPE